MVSLASLSVEKKSRASTIKHTVRLLGLPVSYVVLKREVSDTVSDKYKIMLGPGIIPIRLLLGIGFSTANLVYLWYSLFIYMTSFPVKDRFISRNNEKLLLKTSNWNFQLHTKRDFT